MKASDLTPNPANWRLHPPAQSEALAAILRDVGQVGEVYAYRSERHGGALVLVDGHLRCEDYPDAEWDVAICDLNDEEADKILLSRDPLAAMAEVSKQHLEELFGRVKTEEGGLARLMEDLATANKLAWASYGAEAGQAGVDVDEVPAPPDKATTRRGDLWQLGDHRLLCGDSAAAADVDRLLGGAPVHLVNTDPPYNVAVEPRSNNAIAAGLSSFPEAATQATTHAQEFDLARHPKKAKNVGKKLRAKDRPLANDFVNDKAFQELLRSWFGTMARVLVPGHGFYIWGGYRNCSDYPAALAAAGLYFSQAVIWVKEHPVMNRKDFMGNHEWCQPGNTAVLTPDGEVPISSLRNGDRVIGFRRNDSMLTSRRGAVPVLKTERRYAGPLHRVLAGRRETYCTPGHIWSVRLSSHCPDRWCVYLMRRGRWWRLGKSKLLSTWGFGVKHRLKTEDGDAAWILSVHETNLDATIAEQVAQVRYGIPTTTWAETHSSRRTLGDVGRFYACLDLGDLERGALRALADHGRDILYPFLDRAVLRNKCSARVSFSARTCNLLPGVMLVPVQAAGVAGYRVPWQTVDQIVSEPFDGVVHSLEVPGSNHYVADGLVTHNCFYGWREGGAHRWFGQKNVPDVWRFAKPSKAGVLNIGSGLRLKRGSDGASIELAPPNLARTVREVVIGDEVLVAGDADVDVWAVKKVTPQNMVHLTEKPVELALRAVRYSSLVGENVLDLFGGSGSTLMACEVAKRRAFVMELDELYCDVIVQRWERFTGRKATRA